MRGERTGGREQQGVDVVRADEGIDGDDAVGARLVLDDHGLAPALCQLIAEQPCGDVLGAARPQADDEFDRPLRPGLWLSLRLCDHRQRQGGKGGHHHARDHCIQL